MLAQALKQGSVMPKLSVPLTQALFPAAGAFISSLLRRTGRVVSHNPAVCGGSSPPPPPRRLMQRRPGPAADYPEYEQRRVGVGSGGHRAGSRGSPAGGGRGG